MVPIYILIRRVQRLSFSLFPTFSHQRLNNPFGMQLVKDQSRGLGGLFQHTNFGGDMSQPILGRKHEEEETVIRNLLKACRWHIDYVGSTLSRYKTELIITPFSSQMHSSHIFCFTKEYNHLSSHKVRNPGSS